MNESVKDLVNAIADGNAMETENSFAAAMSDKLSGMLDAKRQDMAKNMFASEAPVMEDEEDFEVDEVEEISAETETQEED